MTDPAAPTTPLRERIEALEREARQATAATEAASANFHAGREYAFREVLRLMDEAASSTPAEAECDHPPSMLTTSTYNGPDGRMAGVEQRCECGASWGSTTPAEALHQHRFDVVIRDDGYMILLGCSNQPLTDGSQCPEVYQWDR